MWSIKIPELSVLHCENAIRALNDVTYELEEQRGKELTEKQTAALSKLGKGLISSIKAELWSSTLDKKIKETPFISLCARSPLFFPVRVASYLYALLEAKLS